MHTPVIAKYPVLDLAPPVSVDDFVFEVQEGSNSGFGFNSYNNALNEKMIWYYGYRTFLDLNARDIPPDTRYVNVYHDPESVKTDEDFEILQSRKEDYSRVYSNLQKKLDSYFVDNYLEGPEADFRCEKMENDCVWLLKLQERNPILCFVVSFDKKKYTELIETHMDIARREWYLTFQKENTCHISPLHPDKLEKLKTITNVPGMASFILMIPPHSIDSSRIYFLCEYYFVAHENINPVDKNFLDTNTKSLGMDILNGVVDPYAETDIHKGTKRAAEDPDDRMEIDEVKEPTISNFLPPSETNAPVVQKKKRGKKDDSSSLVGTDILSYQLSANYYHIYCHLLNVVNVPMITLTEDHSRTKDPNFTKKIESLQEHVSITMYYKVMNFICEELIKEEMKDFKKTTESEKTLKLVTATIINSVNTGFITAQTQKNQKKQEHTKNASPAWKKFIEDYLTKADSPVVEKKISEIFKTLYTVSNLIYIDNYEICFVAIEESEYPVECLVTKTKITQCIGGQKLIIRQGNQGYKLFFKDASTAKLAMTVIKTIPIWENAIDNMIKTHVRHNFKLFKASKKEVTENELISKLMLEQDIYLFFTQYALNTSSSETLTLFVNSLKNAEFQNVAAVIARIPETQIFTPIDDLINLAITTILESLKTFACFKNILLKMFT